MVVDPCPDWVDPQRPHPVNLDAHAVDVELGCEGKEFASSHGLDRKDGDRNRIALAAAQRWLQTKHGAARCAK